MTRVCLAFLETEVPQVPLDLDFQDKQVKKEFKASQGDLEVKVYQVRKYKDFGFLLP